VKSNPNPKGFDWLQTKQKGWALARAVLSLVWLEVVGFVMFGLPVGDRSSRQGAGRMPAVKWLPTL
jgi:hypothetical protein